MIKHVSQTGSALIPSYQLNYKGPKYHVIFSLFDSTHSYRNMVE